MAVGMMGRYTALDGSGTEGVGLYLQEFVYNCWRASYGDEGERLMIDESKKALYRDFEAKYGISLDEVLKNPEFQLAI